MSGDNVDDVEFEQHRRFMENFERYVWLMRGD